MVVVFDVNINKLRGSGAMGMLLCHLRVSCTANSSTSQKSNNHVDNNYCMEKSPFLRKKLVLS